MSNIDWFKLTNQPAQPCHQLCVVTSAPCHTPSNYTFRYDDGYSASIGAKRCPLILGQPLRDGEFIFRNPPSPMERPSRVLPPIPQPWWQDKKAPVHVLEKPPPRPRYLGLHYDLTRNPPREFDIRNF